MCLAAYYLTVAGRGGSVTDARMTRDYSEKIEELKSEMSRRHVLAGATALVTTGGALVVVGEPAKASASVSVDSLTVSDATFERESVRPILDVTAAFEFDVGDEPVNALEFGLLVDGTEIASDELVTDAVAADGDTTLSGSVLESEQWSESNFTVGYGENVTNDLQITLEFRVVASDGAILAEDSAGDTASVNLSHPRESALIASVGGSGSIRSADE